MRLRTPWDYLAILIPVLSAATGAGFYLATFLGAGWPTGKVPLAVAWCAIYLPWARRLYLDRQYFLEIWGIGLYGVSQRFRMQMFPARREQWLNPLGWAIFAVLLVHFGLLFVADSHHVSPAAYSNYVLRLLSAGVVAGAVTTLLQSLYPPTLRPEDL